MPAPRSFDYEYLKRLAQEHPDWSHQQYADAVTRHEREVRKDPKYPRIRPNTIAAVLHRFRDTWLEQGVRVPPRRGLNRLLPWTGIPQGYRMDTRLRHLRVLAQLDLGNPVKPREARLAEKFATQLRESRQVLDLTRGGRQIVRAARPDEVDGTGELLELWARWPGLSDKQWESMTPAERRATAAKWLPVRHDTPADLP